MNFILKLIEINVRLCSVFIINKESRKKFRSNLMLKLTNPIIYKRYVNTLKKLKAKSQQSKIKVAFLVGEPQKWNCQILYDLLSKHPNFEPIVLLSPVTEITNKTLSYLASIEDLENFFKNLNVKWKRAYDKKSQKYLPLEIFKPDIVFYPQPWGLDQKTQGILKTSEIALTCYTPYCFHMFNSKTNYTAKFHARLWTYFVECDDYRTLYMQKHNAQNCITVGNVKLDHYIYKPIKANSESKSLDHQKKIHIIYAPHHSFGGQYRMATFAENGEFILNLARQHPEFQWTFKPHPRLKDEIIINKILTKEQTEQYYKDWEEIGQVHNSGNYQNLFDSSDLMITDCISFLAEYFPSAKPLIFLESKKPKIAQFSTLGKEITEHYYRVTDNNALKETFDLLTQGKQDPLKHIRLEKINALGFNSVQTASVRILNYLEEQMSLKKSVIDEKI